MFDIGSPRSDYMGKAINFEKPVDVRMAKVKCKENCHYTLRSCKLEINRIRDNNQLRLCWVPGRENVKCNEMVDLLARKGSSAAGPLAVIKGDKVKPPICAIKMKVETANKDRWKRRLKGIEGCMSAKLFLPSVSSKKTKLLGLNKNYMIISMGILTLIPSVSRMYITSCLNALHWRSKEIGLGDYFLSHDQLSTLEIKSINSSVETNL
uniref:Uncharacterized protein n=1 Tax=Megaselia scalaris TaxID=36166 RepID=T1GSI6_MEGSC